MSDFSAETGKNRVTLAITDPTIFNSLILLYMLGQTQWISESCAPNPETGTLRFYFLLVSSCFATSSALYNIALGRVLGKPAIFSCIYNGFATLLAFGAMHSALGIQHAGTPIQTDLGTGIYFSLVTFTTLGYGDYQPCENTQILSAIKGLFGYFNLAVTIAIALAAIHEKKKV